MEFEFVDCVGENFHEKFPRIYIEYRFIYIEKLQL